MTNTSKLCKGHVTNSNIVIAQSDNDGGQAYTNKTAINASLLSLGYANNIRG